MNAEKALKTLEYQKILDMLKTHVSSERARELADETRPTDDKNLAESWLTETFEADKILYEQSLDPNFAIDNIVTSLERTRKLSNLTMAELLKIARVLKVSRILKNTLSRAIDADVIKGYSRRKNRQKHNFRHRNERRRKPRASSDPHQNQAHQRKRQT